MGLDLGIYPLGQYLPNKTNLWLCHSKLELHRDYTLFDLIRAIDSTQIPEDVVCSGHFGDTYREIQKDAYGSRLKYVRAKEFKKLGYIGTDWNNAILKFLRELPTDVKVILYWH